MKMKHALISIFLLWLITGGSFSLPPEKAQGQNIKPWFIDTPKIDVEAIIESSRRDSLAYVKSADENARYQKILIDKFKKQEKEIAALKKENMLLKSAVNNCDTLVIDNTKKSFWKRIFHRKNKNLQLWHQK